MDHLQRKTLKLETTTFLVLDETDRMLDMGFSEDINKILSKLPKHQTLLFSATIPKNIMSLAEKFLHQPARIAVGGDNKPIENVKQETLQVTEASKYDQLVLELEKRTGSIIVFVKTKRGAERLAKKLRGEDYSVDAIHGDLRQSKRDRVILNYRKLKFRILVATDVAARGLDIPHIEHVINYDITQSPEDYVHRIGRTARAGAKGFALTFLTNADRGKWDAIQKLINPSYKSQSGGSSRPGSSKSYKGKPRKGSRGGSKFGSPKASGGQGSKQFTFKSKTKKTFSKTKKTFVKKPA
jgi:superfamily II DNA/RNA helicase